MKPLRLESILSHAAISDAKIQLRRSGGSELPGYHPNSGRIVYHSLPRFKGCI